MFDGMMFLRPVPATLYRNRNQSAKEKGVDVFIYYCFHILCFFLDVLVLKPAISFYNISFESIKDLCRFQLGLPNLANGRQVNGQRLSHGSEITQPSFSISCSHYPWKSHEFPICWGLNWLNYTHSKKSSWSRTTSPWLPETVTETTMTWGHSAFI